VFCEAAWSAARTRATYLTAKFGRFSHRMGKRNECRAILAVAYTMIVISWHVVANAAPRMLHSVCTACFQRLAGFCAGSRVMVGCATA